MNPIRHARLKPPATPIHGGYGGFSEWWVPIFAGRLSAGAV
jgi:hypothetical protein